MVTWSHSRIGIFETCPYKYKLQYLDRMKVAQETTIEAFMGDMVHQSLEKLYKDLTFKSEMSEKELIDFYKKLWKDNYPKDILIAKKEYNEKNYFEMGKDYLERYYRTHKPFDELTTIALESQFKFPLDKEHQYHIRMDRLATKDNNYYICDYKTNASMKTQDEADEDRQLAMYSLWVHEKFKDAKKVILRWHMLKFDKVVESYRTKEELNKLKKETLEKIKEIEKAKEFPTNVTGLCNYCGYKQMCPEFKHEFETKELSKKEFREEDGVKLVDELMELEEKNKEIKEKFEETKKELVEYAVQKEITSVYGSKKKANLKEIEKIVYKNKDKVEEKLKKLGIYDDFANINYLKLNSLVKNGGINLGNLAIKEKDYQVRLAKK